MKPFLIFLTISLLVAQIPVKVGSGLVGLTGATGATGATGPQGSISTEWQLFTITHTQLTTAGLTQTINLVSTSARTKVCGVSIKTTAAFSGGTIDSMTVSVGDAAGSATNYAPAFTIFSAPGATNYQDTIPATVASVTSAASTITATFTSTTDNVNAATLGSVGIDVCTVVIP